MSDNGATRPQRRPPGRSWLVAFPLIAFAVLAGLFLFRLGAGDPARIPSALIG
ncbi:MAG: DsbE family thiol:disulfide interchange protein, partial [Afipia sp.]|nr:DsbE family thiol:disulfide interchange protein [Afipia sp.]